MSRLVASFPQIGRRYVVKSRCVTTVAVAISVGMQRC